LKYVKIKKILISKKKKYNIKGTTLPATDVSLGGTDDLVNPTGSVYFYKNF